MSIIIDYLSRQKSLLMPAMDEFTSEQLEKYGGLTSEYAQLLNHIRHYLLRGGKWHRPALSLLSYQLFGGKDSAKVRRAALATEVMHRFLLVHDDIIDQDLMRHNGPTIEKIYQDHFSQAYIGKKDVIYSKGNAIVAGDVVNTLGYSLVLGSGLDTEIQLAVMAGLNQMIMETGAGWQLQNEQNYMRISDVTYADFFKGMQLVSCQYSVVWPLRIGEILAGRLTEASWDKNMEIYGWNSGAAFQIVDDIIGMFGDEQTTGKPAGHDYREGKKTHLVLKAYEQATDKQRKFLERTLGTDVSAADVETVKSIMIETGALKHSQALANDHVATALKALKKVSHQSDEAMALLTDFGRFLVSRTH
jgi:geranylgeranyl pyrophosphate synthase